MYSSVSSIDSYVEADSSHGLAGTTNVEFVHYSYDQTESRDPSLLGMTARQDHVGY